MNSFEKFADTPFAASAGIATQPRGGEDPFGALDDLSAAVEALCPIWPPRPPFVSGGKLLR